MSSRDKIDVHYVLLLLLMTCFIHKWDVTSCIYSMPRETCYSCSAVEVLNAPLRKGYSCVYRKANNLLLKTNVSLTIWPKGCHLLNALSHADNTKVKEKNFLFFKVPLSDTKADFSLIVAFGLFVFKFVYFLFSVLSLMDFMYRHENVYLVRFSAQSRAVAGFSEHAMFPQRCQFSCYTYMEISFRCVILPSSCPLIRWVINKVISKVKQWNIAEFLKIDIKSKRLQNGRA